MESQDRLSRKVKNFRFNLGFSGHYFKHGTSEENEGDELLVKHADRFSWFPHMYKHRKPHLSKSLEELVSSMNENKLFAEVRIDKIFYKEIQKKKLEDSTLRIL